MVENNNNNYVLIMAGGVGSRFWPKSRNHFPKQFIDILGIGKSLLQLTYERFGKICLKEYIY
jgi:mannose-1-phosphate guanylyltransferase